MSMNKTLGSTLIIAGTTIGAGMLALPLASAGLGFATATLAMLGIWALMIYTALLMLEVHQHADQNATLHTLAHQLLGEKRSDHCQLRDDVFVLFSLRRLHCRWRSPSSMTS